MMPITESDLQAMRSRTERARNPAKARADDAAKAEKWAKGEERKLSQAVCAWLTAKEIPHIVARTDRRSTIREGWPDITAMRGCALWDFHARVCCVELKCDGGKLSQDQLDCHAELARAGIPVITAYDLKTAIDFFIEKLRIDKAP